MKRPVLFLSTALLIPALLSAQIPNGGFESWTPSGGGWSDPDGWITWNSVTYPVGGVLSCEQGSPGAVGSYYARVITQNVPGLGVLPGLLFTGDMTASGFPYTSRPEALNGKYQYNIPAGDGGTITASFAKWNSLTQTSEGIGGGVLNIPPGVQGSWQSFSIPISWIAPDDPDSAVVAVLSSTGGGVAGSTVSVDDLSFGAFTGVSEVAAEIQFSLSPSPVSDQLTIVASTQMLELELIDMSGRVRSGQSITGLSTQADVQALANGLYIARVRFADGSFANRTFVKN